MIRAALVLALLAGPALAEPPRALPSPSLYDSQQWANPTNRTSPITEEYPRISPGVRTAISIGCAPAVVSYLPGEPAVQMVSDDIGFALAVDPVGRWSLMVVDSKSGRTCEIASGPAVAIQIGVLARGLSAEP